MLSSLPTKFYSCFWDVDPKQLDISKHSFYITERLLELGDSDSLLWLGKTYGQQYINDVVKKSKNLSLKSANFYSIYFDIDRSQILCLQEEFRKLHRAIWLH